ncbi:MAG: aspartyl/asparaginyl beta-hydroxylase domain-containing protein [Sphingomonadales bacterium]|nr:aspartyl/asparaginyl beta-hydroxylase domain-containing protein [Sphingomonadales bacterium]
MSESGKTEGGRLSRWILKKAGRFRHRLNRWLAKYSKIGDPAIFDNAVFPWAAGLEANWRTIRDEAEAVLKFRTAIPPMGTVSPDHKRLDPERKWQSFFLCAYGVWADVNCARCPETARLVKSIPGIKTAMYSIHAPGMHIPSHVGVSKFLINGHLALKVPREAEKCRIDVAGETYVWREGEFIAFDETYRHEVWNDTDESRVILLVQFDRPMRFPANALAWVFLKFIQWSPFMADGKRNMLDWLARYEDAERAERTDSAR